MTTADLRKIAQNLSTAVQEAEAEAIRTHNVLMAAINADQDSITSEIRASSAAERALDAALEAEHHAWQAVSDAEQYDYEANYGW